MLLGPVLKPLQVLTSCLEHHRSAGNAEGRPTHCRRCDRNRVHHMNNVELGTGGLGGEGDSLIKHSISKG